MNGYVLLEDGARFDGELVTYPQTSTGELVFTTGMSGYQESVSDPSFAGQLLVFTYPEIGNYGVSAAAMESNQVHARGVIMRRANNGFGVKARWLDWLNEHNIPAISTVDTRTVVQHIRSEGAMRGGIFPDTVDEQTALERVKTEPPMGGHDLASAVTTDRVIRHTADGTPRLRVAALDTGIKKSIVCQFVERNIELTLYPCNTSADELIKANVDAFFLVPGPGDPAALGHIAATVKQLLGKKPLFGICLGHQLLARAVGLTTFKLPYGHRGANHPVKDLTTGQVAITSQNHGFAVSLPHAQTIAEDEPVVFDTDAGSARITHISLYDRTIEGFELLDVPALSVQYHPEAGPGPNDSLGLFDNFVNFVEQVA